MKQDVLRVVPPAGEADIIAGLRAGDERSIHILYTMHYKALCYLAEKLVHDREDAHDLATETFLKLLRKKYDFHDLSDIRAFLFISVRNACIDLLRKTKRRERGNRQLGYLMTPDENFGEHEMITAKVLQTIHTGMESLPGQCQKIFKAIFLEGKTTAVIAAELGISPQTVLNQKTKALRMLREILEKGGMYSYSLFLYALSILYSIG